MKFHLLGLLLPAMLLSGMALPAMAQDAQSPKRQVPLQVALGWGTVGHGPGLRRSSDIPSAKMHLEYAPKLNRYVGLGSRLAVISGARKEEYGLRLYDQQTGGNVFVTLNYTRSYQAINLEQEAYLYPLGTNRRIQPALGLGGYVGYGREYGVPSPTTTKSGDSRYDVPFNDGVFIGYMASANLDVALGTGRLWLVGLKGSFQNDTFHAHSSVLMTQVKLTHSF